MTQVSDLAPNDQTTLMAFMSPFRETFVTVAQALNRLTQLDTAWIAAVKAAVESLDVGAIVPDAAPNGAGQLNREEILALMASAEDVRTNHDSPDKRALYIKVCGLQRTMG